MFKFQNNSKIFIYICVSGQHFSLRQLGICEPPSRRGLAFCSEMGLPHRGFSVGTSQDLDTDSQAVMSPERAMRLWGRGGLGKSSGRSSCLSSRSNSVLTLTDTEHENKSDSDNGRTSFRLFSVFLVFFPSLCSERHLIDVILTVCISVLFEEWAVINFSITTDWQLLLSHTPFLYLLILTDF